MFHEHSDGTRILLYGMMRDHRRHRCSAAGKRQLANPKGDPCPGLEGKGKRTSLRASHVEAFALTEMLGLITEPGRWDEYREAAGRRAVASKQSEATAEAGQRRLVELAQERERLNTLYVKGRIDEATLDDRYKDIDRATAEAEALLQQAEAIHAAETAVGVTIDELLEMEIRPPLPDDLADLDEIGEEQIVGWLYAEARRMRHGEETLPEGIAWLRALMDHFDATVVLDPTGTPRLEIKNFLPAAA